MITKIFILITLIFPFNQFYVYSQVTQEWVAVYDSSAGLSALTIDGQGNVYVTGTWNNGGASSMNDYLTIKYNSSGVQQWFARYNGPGNNDDRATTIKVDEQSNVYVTGESYSGANYETSDFATIKYNSSGVQQWVARYNGTADSGDYRPKIALDNQGNIYISGFSRGAGGISEYATIKYNSSGIQQWVSRCPGNGGDNPAPQIDVDLNSNVYITGSSSVNGTGSDFATVKYNSTGVQQWLSRYNGFGTGRDIATSLKVDFQGNVYVTGLSNDSMSVEDYLTIKYNPNGVQQWVTRYNGTGNGRDLAWALAIDLQGNTYVTGFSTGTGNNYDFATVKYNPSGVQQWAGRYDGPANGFDYGRDIAVDVQGNVYITGDSPGNGTGRDFATIKYNSSGIQQWAIRYNSPGFYDDNPKDLSIDANNNVYVCGSQNISGFSYGGSTIKYSQPIGIQTTSTEIPNKFSLSQNYPNPFNPVTNITFDLPKESFVKLKIYDALGKEISILANQDLKAGSYKIDWDASNYPSGVYFYKLEAGSFVESKKMILIK